MSQGDITVLNSKDQYNEILDEFDIKYKDPRNLDEIIKSKKELYSKLKFQYIEQETKERFLRLIIENKPIFIDLKDLTTLVDQNADLKKKLKTMKTNNESILQELLDMSQSVSQQATTMTALSDSNDDLQAQILAMNSKISEIIEQTSEKEKEFNMDVDDTIISKINDYNNDPDLSTNVSIANSITDLNDIVEQRNKELEKLGDQIQEQTHTKEQIESQIIADKSKIDGLQQAKTKLLNNLNEAIRLRKIQFSSQSENTSELKKLDEMGQQLSNLISTWLSLTQFKIEFEEIAQDDRIVLRLDNMKLIIQFYNDNRLRCFKIVQVEGISVDSQFIDSCNYSEDCVGYFIRFKLLQ